MATVVKNFRIKSGLIVEGTTGTINGQNILTETGGNAYILNLVGGATLVKSVDTGVFNVDGSGKLTVNSNTFDAYGAASSAQTAAISAAASDATTKANNAQSAAITAAATDATTKVAAEAALRVSGDAASVSTAAADATTKANAAQAAAISTAASDATSKVAAARTAVTSEIATAKSEAITSAGTYTDGKISALINGAPTILDTLKEIADALTADEGTAATLATTVSGKVSKAGDTMSGNLAMGTNKITGLGTPTAGTDATTKDYVDTANTNQSTTLTAAIATAKSEAISAASTDATTKANSAQSAATSAAATDATTKANAAQAAAEATAATARNAVLDGTTKFTAVNINDLVSERAVQAVLASVSTGASVMSWAASSYASAKLLVKFATGTHTQISEVLLSLDSSNNIAITEFATVGTNGDLGTTTATYSGGNVGISVNTVNANTTVTVIATLIK